MPKFLILLCCIGYLRAQTLEVYVYEESTQEPLIGANILRIAGDTASFTTNEAGFVSVPITGMPLQISVSYVGLAREVFLYERREDLPKRLQVKLSTESPFSCPIIVVAPGTPLFQIMGMYQIPRDEALRMPAAFFDPARAAAMQAGVSQTNDGINALSIHGLHPELMRWRIHGLEVVNPNHLPNAGTLSDRAAQGAGGVFLVSSQALGASYLHTGDMHVGVGDAIAGVMDLTLRDGGYQRRRTLQMGLLGLDGAVSGSFDRNRWQYLANYRYSTVGILSQLGVKFGGEQIRFQDINFNLHRSASRLQSRFFVLAGSSSNNFDGAQSDDAVGIRKLSVIDFGSRTAIVGTHHLMPWGDGYVLDAGAAYSTQRNTRLEQRNTPQMTRYDETDEQQRLSTNASLIKRHKLRNGSHTEWRIGVLTSLLQYNQTDSTRNVGDLQAWTIQPLVRGQWSGKIGSLAVQSELGVHYLYAPINRARVPQPRLQTSVGISRRLSLIGALGTYAQMPSWVNLAQVSVLPNSKELREQLRPIKSTRGSVGLKFLKAGIINTFESTIQGFLQEFSDIATDGMFRSPIENVVINQVRGYVGGQSRGVDLSVTSNVRRWRYRANLSLFNTSFDAPDGGSERVNARYSTDYIANMLVEKEWTKVKQHKRIVRSASVRGVLSGPQNLTPIDPAASAAVGDTRFDHTQYGTRRSGAYGRLDMRISRRVERSTQRMGTLSFELQNVLNRKNVDYVYYDPILNVELEKMQLGLIPNLNWRFEW